MMLLAPVPAFAHEFLDYFEYGRAELSPAGYVMTRSVARYALSGRPARIVITGFVDTAEEISFSEELARKRAQSVATELVLMGVDPALIEQHARGGEALARPTPRNTPERLNRRVVVSVSFHQSSPAANLQR
ncbi:OmpA family protein [Brevundimonas sp. NPDC092305]|uniref:OmpA family protein n=1 Tax=Brevundimonas sp. NPDC092305 TaxID=3363957 RepID=UPI0037FB7F44